MLGKNAGQASVRYKTFSVDQHRSASQVLPKVRLFSAFSNALDFSAAFNKFYILLFSVCLCVSVQLRDFILQSFSARRKSEKCFTLLDGFW
jgi:hypothetical protein